MTARLVRAFAFGEQMTTETDKDQVEEQAAFAAGFSGEAAEPVKAPEPAKEEPAKEPEPEAIKSQSDPIALTAEEIVSLRAAAQELPSLKEKLRDASGHIGGLKSRVGELSDELKATREQKKVEGQAPTLTAVELKRIKATYPEMAEDLTADIGEVLANLAPRQDPAEAAKLLDEKVAERIELARKEDRLEIVRDAHEDFDEVISSDSFREWVRKTATDAQREIAAKSARPREVIGLITAFKSHRDGAVKAKEKSQERLADALTPTGEKRPASRSPLSDEEAMLKGFAEGFANS